MNRPVAYWDSSALVPLCVPQRQTIRATAIYENCQVVAWWGTEVEMVSGLARLQRMGEISPSQFLDGRRLAKDIVGAWTSADSPTSIADEACRLLERFQLRAADALQLAVALEVCEHRPRGHVFVTADRKLADAAEKSGFSVKFL